MNRRKTMKAMAALAGLSFLPGGCLFESKSKPLHFIGFGDAGGKVLEYFYRKNLPAKLTTIGHYKSESLPASIDFIQFTPPGEFHRTETGRKIWSTDMDGKLVIPYEVSKLFEQDEKYVLIAGLGGFTGTKMIESLLPWLETSGKDFSAVCSLPFRWEGKTRTLRAKGAVKKLQSIEEFHWLDLNKERMGNCSVKEAFENADEQFYKLMGELVDINSFSPLKFS